MRRSVLIMLLAATPMVVAGCRQTTGPNATGPLTPLAPTTLSPLSTGQTPTLGPFGGPTRVTPPAAGTVAPNNYMGGTVAPSVQSNLGTQPGGFVSRGNQVIGSGVQVAGFTDTNTVLNQVPAPVSGPVISTAPSDPRSGGMRVIDLTNSPPPPGYRPQTQTVLPNTFRGQSQQGFAPQNLTPQNLVPQNQPVTPQAFGNPNQGFQQNGFQNGLQPVQIPSPGRIATAPEPTRLNEIPSNPAPIGTAPTTPQSNLQWRTPGARF